jgi:TRAP-type C4-dicarboxylate transport system substrate-binding protein
VYTSLLLFTAGHGGVAKYYSYDEHTRVPDVVIMNDSVKELIVFSTIDQIRLQRGVHFVASHWNRWSTQQLDHFDRRLTLHHTNYSYDEHTRVPDVVIMNDSVKERLTAEQYKAVQEAAKESTEYEKKVFKKAVEEEKKIATKDYGVQYNEVDSEPFQKLVQPLHDEFKNNEDYRELYRSNFLIQLAIIFIVLKLIV